MNAKLRQLPLILLAAFVLSACVTDDATWYQERCERAGLKKGTAAFNQCTARDRAWIAENNRRANEGRGP